MSKLYFISPCSHLFHLCTRLTLWPLLALSLSFVVPFLCSFWLALLLSLQSFCNQPSFYLNKQKCLNTSYKHRPAAPHSSSRAIACRPKPPFWCISLLSGASGVPLAAIEDNVKRCHGQTFHSTHVASADGNGTLSVPRHACPLLPRKKLQAPENDFAGVGTSTGDDDCDVRMLGAVKRPGWPSVERMMTPVRERGVAAVAGRVCGFGGASRQRS
jgi:hypothetical protein